MFDVEQVQLQFNVDNDIADLKISNSVLYLATRAVVYRIDLNHPEVVSEFKVAGTGTDAVDAVYTDPKGHHVVVKTTELNYHYINRDASVVKTLHKLKGHDVTCAAFCFRSTDDDYVQPANTGSMLLGMSNGCVYELIVDAAGGAGSDYFAGKVEKTFKQVLKVDAPVVDIRIAVAPGADVFDVLVASTDSVSVITGFRVPKYHHKSSNFADLARADRETVKADVKLAAQNLKTFCTVAADGETAFLDPHGATSYSFRPKLASRPRDAMLSEYHVFLLLESGLLAYNQLNGALTSEFKLDPGEIFLGVCADPVERTFWLYSSSNIYEILIENESRDIWQIMLSQKSYDEALGALGENDVLSRDIVLIAKADDLAAQQKWADAADVYGMTSKATEEVLLVLKDDPQASLQYLHSKLVKLPKAQVMQKITLSSWMVELYMVLLNDVDNEINSYKSTTILNNSQEKANDREDTVIEALKSKQAKIVAEFERFLAQNSKSLHKNTAYQIMSSHNRKSELLHYASLIKDYDVELNYYINLGRWQEALKVLLLLFDKNSNSAENLAFVYKYSTVLMMNEPKDTVATWMKIKDFVDLDFNRLLPAMTTYNKIVCNTVKPPDNEALNLLKFLIDNRLVRDKVIHNTYLCLLVAYPFGDGEGEVLRYLEKNVGGDSDTATPKEVLFDTDFILRLCHKYNKIRAIIYIHSIAADYDEAVSLALEHDLIELASVIADRPTKAFEYSLVGEDSADAHRPRKKLWLKIAEKLIHEVLKNDKYLVQHEGEIVVADAEKGIPVDIDKKNPAIQLVLRYVLDRANKNSETNLITIQDLLGIFPDFTVIDNFKDEIVKSLEEYSANLDKLNDGMNRALATSVSLKAEIAELGKNRFLTVEPKESCAICHKLLITRKFFTYPCFHSFHQDCLVTYHKASKNYRIKNSLYIAEKKLVNAKKLGDVDGVNAVKREIDELLKERCAFCSTKITEIDDAFVDDDSDF